MGFNLSRGKSIHDVYPELFCFGSWQSMCANIHQERAADKATAGYFCAPMEGRRLAEHVGMRQWLAVDLDRIDAGIYPDVRAFFMGFSSVIWNTHSSTPAAPRLRVILELGRPVDRATGIALGAVLDQRLRDEFGDAVQADPSTYRGEQPLFNPPAGPIGVTTGRVMAVDDARLARMHAANAQAAAPTGAPGVERVQHGRNEYLSRRAFQLRKAGLAGQALADAVHGINLEVCDPPLAIDEVRGIAARKARIVADPAYPVAVDRGRAAPDEGQEVAGPAAALGDFHAFLPNHTYIHIPTRALWPAASVDGHIKPWPVHPEKPGKLQKPSAWLDVMSPVTGMSWEPGAALLVVGGGMGATFNTYRGPDRSKHKAGDVEPWLAHLRWAYPEHADHIMRYLAFKIQHPGIKINHAIVLGGSPGLGKDTLLEPVKLGVGEWNWSEVSPTQMLGRFNGWAKCVMLRINEARDLGAVDRFGFYEHCKQYLAAPPNHIRVDEKNVPEFDVCNVSGVIITTNHRTDGLYLPADDRRHYVAWSHQSAKELPSGYFPGLWGWYQDGGIGAVVRFLEGLDLTYFDPKASPVKTSEFLDIVEAGEAPERGELQDVLEALGNPRAVTLGKLVTGAQDIGMLSLADELNDRKHRRQIPHKLARVGYIAIRNPDAEDGMWRINNRRQAVYGPGANARDDLIRAARGLT